MKSWISLPKDKSLQKQLKKLRLSMAVLILSILILFGSLLFWSSMVYSHILEGYRDLQTYYYSVSSATDAIKNRLINEAGRDLSSYSASIEKARSSIARLEQNPYIQDGWRFALLSNMLDAYDEAAMDLETQYQTNLGPRRYQYYYDDFLSKDQQIQDTSTSYYHLLTTSMSRLQEKYSSVRLTCLAAAGVATALTILWTGSLERLFKKDLSRPIREISENIQSIRNGDYTLSKEEASTREMLEIYDALDEMAKKIKHSLDLEKQNADLEKKLVQSELRMLQNQINPHFLFNTLNMIYCLCETGESEEAADMIFRTSHLLRYGLDSQKRICKLGDELGALEDYIGIQQVRLNGKIEFVLDKSLSSFALQQPVPPMILQPLVENAILHGLKNCLQNGKIEIRAFEQDERIVLHVEDNGTGMSTKKLQAVLAQDQNGLGLFNVLHRMEMFYGSRFRYSVESLPEQGTVIELHVPKEQQ